MYKSIGREVGMTIFKTVTIITSIVLTGAGILFLYDMELPISDGYCNVAVFPLEGTILPFYGLVDAPLIVTPEAVSDFFERAENEVEIEAILLEINSPGGTPVASERIMERIADSTMPVVGLVGDMAASGGYMAAVATNHLVASPMSQIGSIGVSMSYVDYAQQNEDSGITFNQLSTGEFKDAGNPDKPLTEAERERFLEDLEVVNNVFIDIVAEKRNIPRERVVELADGSTMTGARALENGLIDSLGGRLEARQALATILERDIADIIFCEYEAPLFTL